ncbi:MAG: twin-arginine translocase TatA/TatE family subunit [Bacteroidales bacterium]|nr:twin-arginine translocase TatA/TatE family subunit [Bacteroidales bacterium]
MTLNYILLGIIGTQEILIIGLIILLLFGGAKIPQLMKGLGRGVKEFKDGVNGLDVDINDDKKKADKDKDKTE